MNMNNIWNIAKQYRAGWLSNHLGFMELIYETEKDKQLAEQEFYTMGFVVIQGSTNWIEPELNKKIHRVFSSM
jgi:hypothetical protein